MRVRKTKCFCYKSEVCSYEPLRLYTENVINKSSFSYYMRCITFWPFIPFFNYEERKKQIQIELGFLYAVPFPPHMPVWKLFLLVRKFQNLWYLKRRVLPKCSLCFPVVSGALTSLPSILSQSMHQFKIVYQILLLHEALLMSLGRITLSYTIILPMGHQWNLFDLIAVGLNRSYLGADSLTAIIKLKK